MTGYKHLGGLVVILLIFAVFLTCFVMAGAENSTIPMAEASVPEYTEVFDKDAVMTINIEAEEEEFQEMLDTATEEEYIKCDITVNGTTVYGAGIRPKGNSSLSMVASSQDTDRFSFKLEFDHYIENQTLLGLDKMVINNIQGDATYMKEYLSYDIMSRMGISTPLFAYAEVTVNGEPWGFYLAVESLEESFALRNYGTGYGMLYKPEGMGMRGAGRMNDFMEQMGESQAETQNGAERIRPDTGNAVQGAGAGRQGFAAGGAPGGTASGGGTDLVYNGDDPDNYADIFDNAVFRAANKDYARVIEALKNLNDGTELEKYIDVDEVLRYFAVNTFVVNLDHYVSNMGHNYYLYEENGQLSILPWDYNLAFGGFQSGSASSAVNFPIDTPVSGVDLSDRPLIGKLLEVPEHKERYHEYLRQIGDEYFNEEYYNSKVDKLNNLIGSYVKEDASAFYTYDQYLSGLEALKTFGQLRAESIRGQLAGDIPSTSEGQSGDSSALIDTASLDFDALGSMGGGKGGFDRDRGRLTPDGQSSGSNAPDRNVPSGEGSDGEAPKIPEDRTAQGDMRQPPDGQMPNGDSGRFPQGGGETETASQANALRNATGIWTLNGPSLVKTAIICVLFLIGGLFFVRKFPRRRYMV